MWPWVLVSLLPAFLVTLFGCADDRKTRTAGKLKSGDKLKRGSSSSKSRKTTRSGSKRGSQEKVAGSRRSSKSKKSGSKDKSSKSKKAHSSKSKRSASTKSAESATAAAAAAGLKSGRSAKSGKNSKSGSKSKSRTKTKSTSVSASRSKEEAPASHQAVPPPQAPLQAVPRLAPQVIQTRTQPEELTLQLHGGLKHFELVNDGADRLVFKVKCSDTELYRVHPVYGIVEPKSTVKIEVLRQNGAAKMDKIVVLTAKADSIDICRPKKEILAAIQMGCHQMNVLPLIVEA